MVELIGLVIRSASTPDWFIISSDLASRLNGSPGVRAYRRHVEVHRSQLPLLRGIAEIDAILAQGRQIDEGCRVERDRVTEPLGFRLREHQHAAVDFIAPRRGVLLADEPRVGKTLSAIMSHDPDRGPLLVVAPLIARNVWVDWIKRRFPGEPVSVLQGKKFDPKAYDNRFIVGHYDIIHAWQTGTKLGTVVFDEAHVLSKPLSRRTAAAAFLASRAEKVLCLTGTPMWNKPIGLYNMLCLLSPASWGSIYDFGKRYCGPVETDYGIQFQGHSNGDELKARMSEIMLHRKWRDLTDVPPTVRKAFIAKLSPQKQLEVDIAAEAIRDARSFTNTVGAIARYRRVLSDVKIPIAIDEASKILDGGDPVVVWAWHKETARAITRELGRKVPTFIVTGSTSQPRREEMFAQWRQTRGALVITIPAGQVGIDLSHARHAVFAEIDFTPALIAQAEMRTFAMTRAMEIIYIIADHEVDRRIVTAMQSKIDTSDRIGVPAAEAALDVLKSAFSVDMPEGDLSRLMDDLLAGMAGELSD